MHLNNSFCFPSSAVFVQFLAPPAAVPSDITMKTVKVKRVNCFDESIDTYTEFFRPYELTSFDETFCIAMTSSAK